MLPWCVTFQHLHVLCVFPPQQTRQQSSSELEEMKVGVEELKEQMIEADKAVAEITASMAELEKKKSKVHVVFCRVYTSDMKIKNAWKLCASMYYEQLPYSG